jgi:hypothetical protein
MSQNPFEQDNRTGVSFVLVAAAFLVALGAFAAWYYLTGVPPAVATAMQGLRPVQPGVASPAATPVAAKAALAAATEDDADGIETVRGLPGYGVFDGSPKSFAPEAVALASQKSTAELTQGLALARGTPGEPKQRALLAAALGAQQAQRKADPRAINAALAPLAKDKDRDVRHNAIRGLMQGGPGGVAALAQSLQALAAQEVSPEAQADLIAALGQLGPEAESAIGILANRVRQSADPTLQQNAAKALSSVGKAGQSELEKTAESLRAAGGANAANAELLLQLEQLLRQVNTR